MRQKRGETQDAVLKAFMTGQVIYVEQLAKEILGEDSYNNVASIRMAITRLRKRGYIIESVKRATSNRKHGYRMADVGSNFTGPKENS